MPKCHYITTLYLCITIWCSPLYARRHLQLRFSPIPFLISSFIEKGVESRPTNIIVNYLLFKVQSEEKKQHPTSKIRGRIPISTKKSVTQRILVDHQYHLISISQTVMRRQLVGILMESLSQLKLPFRREYLQWQEFKPQLTQIGINFSHLQVSTITIGHFTINFGLQDEVENSLFVLDHKMKLKKVWIRGSSYLMTSSLDCNKCGVEENE